MPIKKILILLLVSQFVFSEVLDSTESDEDTAKPLKSDTVKKNKPSIPEATADVSDQETVEFKEKTSRDLRVDKPMSLGLNWNFMSMWLPNKLGANFNYTLSAKKSLVLEYQSVGSKIEIFGFKFGEIKESKYGVLIRSFGDSNTFYFSYGLMKYQFKAELGVDLFGPVTLPIAPLFDISSVGFQFGLGNQIGWSNGLTLGIDWFSIYFHTFSKSRNTDIFNYLNTQDRDDLNKAVDLIYNLPIIEILRLQLNYCF